jgi:hypothetical protein
MSESVKKLENGLYAISQDGFKTYQTLLSSEKAQSDFSLDYIKQQYCNYKCPVKDINLNDNTCSGCDLQYICDKLDINCSGNMESKTACEVCQIDNYIRELRDFSIIK